MRTGFAILHLTGLAVTARGEEVVAPGAWITDGLVRTTAIPYGILRTEPAGAHSVVIRTAGLPAGIYWVRMDTAGSHASRRFVVLR